ncbi:imidazole glycerol phosphate synthase subunit HisH [Leucobacter denitrificans]|uniref:Imidazole glycerol phosphate synthase subunit HisH n=1 Tax=Leucobacter denitrificans TaxID=683042 RepID=A0A7G9S4T0_9MICO|nr:imidazole glycerol phosphate synthase subunit HisH [Leucobacter denitrificans]QNN62855.1 imidazole glycerol phosphate synthase subunit HisH [Leucobacter denitrificans]
MNGADAPRVVVLNYGSGNIHSAAKALARAGAAVEVTGDADRAMEADGLFVPGVGAFDAVMQQLQAIRGDQIIDRRLAGGRPVMGICVGQQIMFERGIERGVETEGLGEWPGVVHQLDAPVLPHMGWNTVTPPQDSVLFRGIERERFYFVHSNAATEWTLEGRTAATMPRVTWAEYGEPFIAAVENGPLCSTQFHPEKSGEAGIQLLRNWIASL